MTRSRWPKPPDRQTIEQREAERNRRLSAQLHAMRMAPRLHVGTYGGSTTGPAPKENVVESAAYENAVRGLGYCMRCGLQCRPQFCHRDEGKGQSIKTDVREGWPGCGPCHYFVGTSGKLEKADRRAEDLRLGGLTRIALRRAGTWPKSVPPYEETTQ